MPLRRKGKDNEVADSSSNPHSHAAQGFFFFLPSPHSCNGEIFNVEALELFLQKNVFGATAHPLYPSHTLDAHKEADTQQ